MAERESCIQVRDDEFSNIRRAARVLDIAQLRTWAGRKTRFLSWKAAVILCPDDKTEELAAAVIELGLDADRFHFYLHEDADLRVMAGWAAAGLPLDDVDTGISDRVTLHKLLGIDFNVRTVTDFAGP